MNIPVLVLPLKVVLHQKVQQLSPHFSIRGAVFVRSHIHSKTQFRHSGWLTQHPIHFKKKVFSCLFLQLGSRSLSLCSLHPSGLFNLTKLQGWWFFFYSVQLRKPSYNMSILIFTYSTNAQTNTSGCPFGEAANAVVDVVPLSACKSIWAAGLGTDGPTCSLRPLVSLAPSPSSSSSSFWQDLLLLPQ